MRHFLIAIFFFSLGFANAQTKADDAVGLWLTAGKEPAKIQIYKSGNTYAGKIIWLKNATENGKPRVDANNPNVSKRANPTIGLVMLSGFEFDGEKQWKNGKIYDPESGKTYDSHFQIKDNTLEVRGFVGISLFGRTEIWTRSN